MNTTEHPNKSNTVENLIRAAAVEAFRVGTDQVEFVKLAKKIASEETEAQTQRVAAQVYTPQREEQTS